MNIKNLFRRAWVIIWLNKYLLVLGILFALGAGSGGIRLPDFSFSLDNLISTADHTTTSLPPGDAPKTALPDVSTPGGIDAPMLAQVVAGILVALLCVLGIAFVALGLISIMARGGIIAAVGQIEQENPFGFRQAIVVGWRRLWRLMVILSIPLIPLTVGAILVVLIYRASFAGSNAGSLQELLTPLTDRGFRAWALAIMLPLSAASLSLGFLQVFADRACILEGTGATVSFKRGWQILRHNPASALLLLLFELVVRFTLGFPFGLFGVGVTLRLFPTRPLLAILALVLPVPLLGGAILRTYLTTLWTLAWCEWTSG